MKDTRKFAGKLYRLFDWASTKGEADKELRNLRAGGKRARKTKATEGYQIWVR